VPDQQSLTGAVTAGFGGGQLIAAAGPACADAAGAGALTPRGVRAGGPPGPACPSGRLPGQGTAAGCVPLTHLGSVHSMAATAAGTPLMQSGVVQVRGAAAGGGPPPHAAEPVQAPAAAAVRLSEPAARAAEITALAPTWLRMVTGMAVLSGPISMTPTVTCAADVSLEPG